MPLPAVVLVECCRLRHKLMAGLFGLVWEEEMKGIEQWLDEYGVSHRNPLNKRIHWVCVPLIVFSLIGLLWSIPHVYFADILPGGAAPFLNWGTLFLALASVYYLMLSRTLFVGMLGVCAVVAWGNFLLSTLAVPLWAISGSIFVLAWIGQFIGHEIEGKKPSFLQDIQFLMIGPAWCMSFLYGKLGIKLR